MEQEKLNTFIRLLRKTHRISAISPFDLGLIVKEPKSNINPKVIFGKIKKNVDIEQIIYDEAAIDEDVIEKIIELFEKGKWVFLEIKKDVSSPLLNQLKHLANHNFLQLIDYKGRDLVQIKIPENSRVIIFAERDFIENKISYPHFYRLFGPTLSIK